MGLSNAQRQARWRSRRPEVLERVLLREAGRCEQLSDGERGALADRLADAAMRHLRRSQELAAMARKVRAGMFVE